MNNDQKVELAMRAVEEYGGLSEILGHEKAATEMGYVLGAFVLSGELNEFEVDLISTLAILGHVATFALNENEALRGRLA